MNSIKYSPMAGCILLALFATWQVIVSETGDSERNYCEPVKRCNPYSSSGSCADSKKEETCAAVNFQDCGKEPAPPNNSHLPQYLVIGDSIARGMFPYLKRKLQGVVEAHIISGKPETAADGARCIKVWVGPNLDRWDVISFNFGLQDSTKTRESDIATYGINMNNITLYLTQTKAGKNGKLISVLTTPTANTSCCSNSTNTTNTGPNGLPCPYTIKNYNDMIYKVMQYFHSITIEDLFSSVNLACCHHSECFFDYCDLYQSSNSSSCLTNFTREGWDRLANNVSTTVRKVLHKQEYVM